MRKISLAVIAIAALATAAAAAPANMESVRLEAFVDGVVRHAMEEQHIAGVSVAVIDRDGPLLLKGYGIAGHGKLVDADTLFRSGSISKTITWIAIMQLVEAGKLTLDDSVNKHLPPELQIPDEGFSEPVRVRHLMTHSAGFEDATLGVNATLDLANALPLSQYLKRYRVHRVRPAGTLTVYSNYGAALAGAIVEHESGMDFPSYAEQRILRPLGVATAAFRDPYPASFMQKGFPAPMPKEIEAHESSGYKYSDGRFVPQSWEFLPHMAPAGGMSASARDMTAYMAALLTPELFARAHVLSARTAMELRAPTFSNDPRLSPNRHGFWQIPVSTGEFAFGHNGGMAFQQTYMGIYPESGIAIFAATNTGRLNGGGTPIVVALPNLISAEFLGTKKVQRATITPGETASYAGCYRPFRRPYHHTEKAVFGLVAALCATALANGDLLLNGMSYLPQGHGVYAKEDRTDRIAFGARNGSTVLYDFSGAGPAERMGTFDSPDWLMLTGVLAALAAFARLFAGFVRLLSGDETRGHILLDGTSVLWLMAIGAFGAASLPWLADFSEPLLHYPGTLLPVACWLFLIAAVATLVASVLLLFVWRPRDWRWFTWTGAVVTLAIFAVFSLTLLNFGFLGFSGW